MEFLLIGGAIALVYMGFVHSISAGFIMLGIIIIPIISWVGLRRIIQLIENLIPFDDSGKWGIFTKSSVSTDEN